jgi:hypothetical protein
MEYYSAIKDDEIMPFAENWMLLEITVFNYPQKKENITCVFAYMWNLGLK